MRLHPLFFGTPLRAATLAMALFLLGLPGFGADARLLSMVPRNAEAVMGADIRAIMNSGLAQEFMRSANNNTNAELNDLIALTGMDPRRDLHEVVAAGFSPAPAAAGKPQAQGLLFVSGNFNADRIAAAITTKGGKKMAYKGRDLWIPPQKDGDSAGAMTFLESGIVLAGDEQQVKRYLDSPPSSLAGPLRARVDAVSSRYDLWMVSTVSPSTLAKGVGGQSGQVQEAAGALQGDMFQKIESVQGGLKLGVETLLGLEMLATTPEDATALMNVMQFFKSMLAGGGGGAQGANSMPPAFGKMLSSVRMTTQANTLMVSLSIPEKDIVDFMKTAATPPPAASAAKRQTPSAKPKPKPQPQQEEIIIIQ
jgi:hypothetical protein